MALTIPATTSGNNKAIDPAVRKFFVDEFERLDPMLEKVFQVGEQQDYNQQEQTMFGIGELVLTPEAEVYAEDVPIQGFNTVYTPDKFGKVVPVSREIQKYDKSALFRAEQLGKAQANAAAVSIGKNAASVFNNGFNNAFTSYGDGVSLFNANHLRADGGTAQSNVSASAISLSEANLETGILAFRQQLDDRGLPITMIPDTLLTPIELEKEALVIVKSDLRSGTADNDANVYAMKEYKGGLMRLVSWNFISGYLGGSSTAWFLLDSMQHKVSWKWGWRPEISRRDDSIGFKNDVIYYKTSYEASYGWSDWRGSWGSAGTGN